MKSPRRCTEPPAQAVVAVVVTARAAIDYCIWVLLAGSGALDVAAITIVATGLAAGDRS